MLVIGPRLPSLDFSCEPRRGDSQIGHALRGYTFCVDDIGVIRCS